MAAAQKVVASLRSVRNDYGLTVRQRAAVMLACSNSALAASLADMAPEIATLSSSSSVTVLKVRLSRRWTHLSHIGFRMNAGGYNRTAVTPDQISFSIIVSPVQLVTISPVAIPRCHIKRQTQDASATGL